MEFIGQVSGMNFKPISNYDNYLKTNASFDVNSNMDFENVLNKQTAQLQNASEIKGGVTVDTKFDDILAQTSVQTSDNSGPTGNFIKSLSSAVNGGLNSTNEAMDAANKAQEAFAAGEDVSVHDVMLASEKASLNFSLAMQLRNKMMSAYTEINNIKV